MFSTGISGNGLPPCLWALPVSGVCVCAVASCEMIRPVAIWQSLETFFDVTTGVGEVLVSSGWGPGMLLKPLQRIGQPLAPHVNSPRLRNSELDDVIGDVLFPHMLIRCIPLFNVCSLSGLLA